MSQKNGLLCVVIQLNLRVHMFIRYWNARSILIFKMIHVRVLLYSANILSVNLFLPYVCEHVYVDQTKWALIRDFTVFFRGIFIGVCSREIFSTKWVSWNLQTHFAFSLVISLHCQDNTERMMNKCELILLRRGFETSSAIYR